jgi:hypothetical protein
VSNHLQRKCWIERYGRLFYHFRYGSCLFVVIDTQDPPAMVEGIESRMEAVNTLLRLDPARIRPRIDQALDWEGTQLALVSEEQSAHHDRVLTENAHVEWTFLFMHMPLWQGEHPAWSRLRTSLGNRPYTGLRRSRPQLQSDRRRAQRSRSARADWGFVGARGAER